MFQAYKQNNLALLRVYRSVGGVCSCGKPNCSSPGKHPAPWPGKKNMGSANATTEYDESIFEGFNVGVATGNGLLVVDVDPRNSGHLTWSDLCKGHQVPDTWSVATGGGGYHHYFRIPDGFEMRSLSFDGVDFQYTGKYVVAPPSIHPSGGEYVFEDCDPEEQGPALAPQWLLGWIRARLSSFKNAMVPANTTHDIAPHDSEWPILEEILSKLSPDIGYSNWIGVGMGLHATGDPRAFELWDKWSATDKDKYVPGECSQKWSSFGLTRGVSEGHTYRWIYAMADLYGIKHSTDDFFDEWFKNQAKRKGQGEPLDYRELAEEGGPLIKSLCDYFALTGFTSIPQFELASALQIMSTCAQGSYKTPTGGSLNLYQWCAAPAGTGKNAFFTGVTKILREVSENLVAPDFGSVAGLRMCLISWNSRLAIRDEFHDEYQGLIRTSNESLKALLKDYKMLWDIPDRLQKVVIKLSSTPQVERPAFGLLAFSTVKGLLGCASGDFLSSGLGSRFLFWPMESFPPQNMPTQAEVPKDVTTALKTIYKHGLTMTAKSQQSANEEMEKVQKTIGKGHAHAHLPQTAAHKTMTMSCQETYQQLAQQFWKQGSSAGERGLDDHSTLYLRKMQHVIRVACLRALSHGREDVEDADLLWGDKIVTHAIESILSSLITEEKVTYSDEDQMNRALKVLQSIQRIFKKTGEPVGKSEIARNVRVASRNIDDALLQLSVVGKIEIIDRSARKVYPTKIERAFRYMPVS